MDVHKNRPLPIRWGIIGCGNVTEIKSGPAYASAEGFSLTTVMRRDETKLKDYAKRHHIPFYTTDAHALINDKNIDAIYIATPPDTHAYYALLVAEAGKPCCIEKPIAPSYDEALTIYNAFKSKNLPLFVAYYRRSLPRFLKIKEWIDGNMIGEVRHINWLFSKPANDMDLSGAYNWRTDATIASGGYFDDLASHGLDLFTYMLGNIKEVQGITTNQQKLYKAKDAITACWMHQTGITGSGSWHFGCHKREDNVTILGSQGKISFSVFSEDTIRLETAEKNIEETIANPKHIQQYHVQNIKKHLTDKTYLHPSTGKTALHTSWVMDRILGKI